MEVVILIAMVLGFVLYLWRGADRERENALVGMWRFDRLIESPAGESNWNDHVVIFDKGGRGRVVPSQALASFQWSVKGDTIRLIVPGIMRGRWNYKIVGDELTTKDTTNKNVVRFRKTGDPTVLNELERQQEELNATGIYWDRDEYAEGFLSKNLLPGRSDDEKIEILKKVVRKTKDIPLLLKSPAMSRMVGLWGCALQDGSTLIIDFGEDGVAVFFANGTPYQSLEYRIEDRAEPSYVDMYEDGYALRYRLRFLSTGQLHLKNELLDAIFQKVEFDSEREDEPL